MPDQATIEEIIREHEPLCQFVARQFFAPGLEHDDLVQEARIGLLAAIAAHDPARSSFRYFAQLVVERRVKDTITRALRRKHGPLNQAMCIDAPLPGTDHATLAEVLPGPCPHRRRDRERDIAGALRDLGRHLTPLEHDALRLIAFEGLSYADAAEQLACTSKQVDNAISRARLKATRLARDRYPDLLAA